MSEKNNLDQIEENLQLKIKQSKELSINSALKAVEMMRDYLRNCEHDINSITEQESDNKNLLYMVREIDKQFKWAIANCGTHIDKSIQYLSDHQYFIGQLELIKQMKKQ